MSAARWVSVSAAADLLDVDRHTIYDGCNRGEVPHRRVGRRVLIDRAWLDGVDVSRAFADSVDGTFMNGRSGANAEAFAADFARAVAIELAQLLGEAAQRAAAPGVPGSVLTPDASDDKEGRHAG
jgi:excisionase family DNA binding protein